MPSDRDQCPNELTEIAEAYVMNTLARVEAAVFGQHLLTCSRCMGAVEDADRYVRAMKAAVRRLRPTVASESQNSP